MRLNKIILIAVVACFALFSCKDFLDIVPDNVATVDHAFANRYQAEGFLYGCYGFMPEYSDPKDNPAFWAGDEAWLYEGGHTGVNRLWDIARGVQGTDGPIGNYWASVGDSYGLNGGKPIFTALRDCNIFLENIHIPNDIDESERKQWIAEAKFLKAFYHFWLLQMYGPVPVIKENVPVSSSAEDVQFYREPVDSVAAYIVQLLDEAQNDLPLTIENVTQDIGRATRPVALALKAKTLILTASPLFNGNPDYAGFTDNRGIPLFPEQYDSEKWQKAADALKQAIDICHEAGHALYDFTSSGVTATLDEATIKAMHVRGAVTERWNQEIVWGSTRHGGHLLQKASIPAFNSNHITGLFRCYAPTMWVVEQFYSKNGVPIEEDKDWQDVDYLGLRKGDDAHKYYIEKGFETCNLHFDREPRFYGAISFDGSLYYGNGVLDDDDMWTVKLQYAATGQFSLIEHSATGYLERKLISRLTALPENSSTPTYYEYSFPMIRLADLYLLYAEALNEAKSAPDSEVWEYIDLVRERSGLTGVVESWATSSVNPDKPATKEGMREIIQRERLIELAFEGHRFWDLRRWKLAEDYMNQPIRGLNILGNNAADFYVEQELFRPTFGLKDYLWPLRTGNLLRNKNLVQNPGW